ncbi:MAG: hypothetical protein WBA22_00955 [Candidatus Methanofastidiosia archaeon]
MNKNLYYAFTEVEMQRVHITYRIDDFDCITEECRYIFYNNGDNPVSILPLPPRKRKTQRNMKVKDSSNRQLVFIPSAVSAPLLESAFTQMLENAYNTLNPSQRDYFKETKETIESDLKHVFMYKPDTEKIQHVCQEIGSILDVDILKYKPFMEQIYPVISILEDYNRRFYYPLITLHEPLEPQTHAMIQLSVERLREIFNERWERIKVLLSFGFLGSFSLSFVPELQAYVSNHLRIYAPEGLLIRDVEFDLSRPGKSREEFGNEALTEELERNLNRERKDYFDERLLYVQLGPEESGKAYNRTHVNIELGLRRKGLHMGLLQLLSLFLWITVLSLLVFSQLQTLDSIFGLLTLSVTILVAIGIYALDKKILNHYIVTQVTLAFIVFVAEIVYLIL